MEKKIELHMNHGSSATSYANNSGFQKFVMSKTLGTLDQTLESMFTKHNSTNRLMIADLGCASGPNTLQVISHIMETINSLCKNKRVDNLPEYGVYLNDLPNNDFNNLFKMLPSFKQKFENCFVSGLPGSFHERLLPKRSLHFAYSCYSLHWLSQVPEGVETYNGKNICVTTTSPEEVFLAYKKQYHIDFSKFLMCRGEEMMHGGHMVLAFIGRNAENHSSKDVCGPVMLLAETLFNMANEDLINMDDLFSFNMPIYFPSQEEVEAIIKQEGSFNLDMINVFKVPWDANECESDDLPVLDMDMSGEIVANCVRAFMEPMLTYHFSNAIDINDLFARYKWKVAKHISTERPWHFAIVVSLSMR